MIDLLAAVDPWRFRPHPEVWLLVGAIVALGGYTVRVIGPKVVPAGQPIVTGRQKLAFWSAVVLLWLAADWPLHDIAEEYLYSFHMIQHLLITFVVPPLFLLATPEWLARLVFEDASRGSAVLRFLAKPVVAGIIFNAAAGIGHWEPFVNLSVENGAFHYAAHLLFFSTALLMWMPVAGPLPEYRIGPFGQLVYLFLMSVIPTVPAAWLTLAEGPVYDGYDHADRLWGVSVTDDQQVAGLIMKLLGGFYLWSLITVLFFRWANEQRRADRRQRVVVRRVPDTYEELEAEFERTQPGAGTESNPV